MPKIHIDFSQLYMLINPCYYQLLWSVCRYLVLYGGAGSGKSVFVAQKLVYRIVNEPGHRILCVRKVARTIRESTFALICSVISQWGLTKLFKINKSDMTITYRPNGNQFIFAGLDDVEKLKSIFDITGIWIEEASEINFDDFSQLDLRLRGFTLNYKQIILSFNPIIESHWLKGHFFDNTVANCLTLRTTYLDNQFIDAEYRQVLESLRETNPNYFRVYGLGEWGLFEGAFFSIWDRRIHTCKPFAIPKEWVRIRSMDWGSYRPYCVGWYAIDYDGRAWKYRELYGYGGKPNVGTKETAKQVAQSIKSIENKAGERISYGVADPACWIKTGSSGPSIAEDFANEGIYFNKADNERLNGWEQFKNRLVGDDGKPWLTVFDTCTHTVRTIPMLTHSKHKPEDVDTDLEDHAADETRYFCMSRPWTPEKPHKAKKHNPYKDDTSAVDPWAM